MGKKILMVCLGNICRSPMAEGVMKYKLKKYHLEGEVDSAGVLSFHAGQSPDKRAIRKTGDKKVDISEQLARQVTKSDFDEFDFIFTMDQSIQDKITGMAVNDQQRGKVHLFLEYAGYPPGSEVPDPYYSGVEAFDQVFNLVDDACEKIITKWNDNK